MEHLLARRWSTEVEICAAETCAGRSQGDPFDQRRSEVVQLLRMLLDDPEVVHVLLRPQVGILRESLHV